MSDMNDAPQKPKRKWIPIVVGVLFLLFVLGVGAVVFTAAWLRNHMEVAETTEMDAAKAFDEVRARFPGQPLLEFRDGTPKALEVPAGPASTVSLTTLHILAFDDDEGKLARIEVPFWLLRLKSGPIAFSSWASGFKDERVKLRVEDLERRGPGIVLDMTQPREGRVLIWAE